MRARARDYQRWPLPIERIACGNPLGFTTPRLVKITLCEAMPDNRNA